jgi:hypothetical protein
MIWDRKRDRIKEAYVANIWAKRAGVDYLVTPNEERYDIQFFDDTGTKVLAEVKVRSKHFVSWFVDAAKEENLLNKSRELGCTPWYLIYCQPTRVAYKLNLHQQFEYTEGWLNESWGKYVPEAQWHSINSNPSIYRGMSSLQWK